MDKTLLMFLVRYPPIGKFVLNMMKKNLLKPFHLPLKITVEKQEKLLRKKLGRLEQTGIGKKLGARTNVRLQKLALTDYSFYEPFFSDPYKNGLMYPLEDYEPTRTSGTSGTEKWFMIPKNYINKTIIETAIPVFMLSTLRDQKIMMEYGDTIYVNSAPKPFLGGAMTSIASRGRKKPPLFDVVPNFNISFDDKVKYFINNADTIDIAAMPASILVSQIMPSFEKPVSLKGLFCLDTAVAEAYFEEITEFAGVSPTTVYGSTETLFCSLPSQQHRLGFFLDWRRGIFEFIPLKYRSNDYEEILAIDQVEVDAAYRVVFTSLETELTRYDTACAFKCVAMADDVLGVEHPIFEFQARLEKTISLHNFTRISEDELIEVFGQRGVQCVEFTTRTQVIKGLEYLVIYLETPSGQNETEISQSVHESLRKIDFDYKELTDFYHYVPVRIKKLPPGVFGKYLSGKLATMPKVERINMSEEEFGKLTETARSVSPEWQPI